MTIDGNEINANEHTETELCDGNVFRKSRDRERERGTAGFSSPNLFPARKIRNPLRDTLDDLSTSKELVTIGDFTSTNEVSRLDFLSALIGADPEKSAATWRRAVSAGRRKTAGDMTRTIKQSVTSKCHLSWNNYVRYIGNDITQFILNHLASC